jgi:hypothetical protein
MLSQERQQNNEEFLAAVKWLSCEYPNTENRFMRYLGLEIFELEETRINEIIRYTAWCRRLACARTHPLYWRGSDLMPGM